MFFVLDTTITLLVLHRTYTKILKFFKILHLRLYDEVICNNSQLTTSKDSMLDA